MSYEVEVDSIFNNSSNKYYAQKIVNYIAERFKDSSIKLSKVPDIRFSISGGVFFSIKKSGAITFFLNRSSKYEHLNQTTDTSTHTHSIVGTKAIQLIDTDFDVLTHYIELSYFKVSNTTQNK